MEVINGVQEDILDNEIDIANARRKIVEIEKEHFESMMDDVSRITEDDDFVRKLLDNEPLVDEDTGTLTSNGSATMATYGVDYSTHSAQAAYAQQRAEEAYAVWQANPADENAKADYYGYKDMWEEYIEDSLDDISSMKDLVQQMYDAQLEALQKQISDYEDSLQEAKDYYEYEKEIQEKTANIASLRKQLTAYAGDDSEENLARLSSLGADLDTAETDLEETQYDKYIQDQTDLLSELYDDYEEYLNERMDHFESEVLPDVITQINAGAGDSAQTIKDALVGIGATDGTCLADSFNNTIVGILGDAASTDGNVITKYLASSDFNKYSSQIDDHTGEIKDTVNSTYAAIARLVRTQTGFETDAAENEYNQKVAEENARKATEEQAIRDAEAKKQQEQQQSQQQQAAASTGYDAATKYGVALSIINGNGGWGVGTDRQNKLQAKGFDYNEIQSLVNQLWNEGLVKSGAWWGHYYGITDLSPYAYSRFAKGGKDLEEQWAFTQEKGAEAILMPDGSMLTPLVNGSSVINAKDTAGLYDFATDPGKVIAESLQLPTDFSELGNTMNAVSQSFTVNIPIDHVQDYNELLQQLQKDTNFEKLVKAMSIDQLTGKSSKLKKYTI